MKNKNKSFELTNSLEIMISDIIAIVVVMFLPAISHALPFPIYYLDPMRLVLFSMYIINRSNRNAYLMAFGLPLFSMLYSGHPIFFKAILISLELFINILLLTFLLKREMNAFFAIFLSIILSKIFYYFMKFGFLKIEILSGKLFSTNLITQLLIVIGLSIVFFVFYRKNLNTF